ncbi:hypothetical protein [Ciceribacter thiooxidans]|uniref:Lipoprotein n=1 Tax=Ciceribacter thiooxidans TaxID=1969821 RepID=A0ABV7I2M8_9HYPH|nr:hypothetical protein [Ciceribacter thiooxidans]
MLKITTVLVLMVVLAACTTPPVINYAADRERWKPHFDAQTMRSIAYLDELERRSRAACHHRHCRM